MASHVFTLDIAAPPECVFDLWVDVRRMPEWTEGLTRVTNLSGPPGQAGTRYSVWFGRSRATTEVIAGDRPRGVTWRIRTGPLAAEIDARFQDLGNRTRLTETITTRGVIAAVWALVLSAGSYKGSFRGELATFARICEREGAISSKPQE